MNVQSQPEHTVEPTEEYPIHTGNGHSAPREEYLNGFHQRIRGTIGNGRPIDRAIDAHESTEEIIDIEADIAINLPLKRMTFPDGEYPDKWYSDGTLRVTATYSSKQGETFQCSFEIHGSPFLDEELSTQLGRLKSLHEVSASDQGCAREAHWRDIYNTHHDAFPRQGKATLRCVKGQNGIMEIRGLHDMGAKHVTYQVFAAGEAR